MTRSPHRLTRSWPRQGPRARRSGTWATWSPSSYSKPLEAEMLIVGSRGHGWTAQTFSVSQHLVRHAPCPVVVVRPPASPDADRIIVGLDGSEESIAALRFACHRACLTNEAGRGARCVGIRSRAAGPPRTTPGKAKRSLGGRQCNAGRVCGGRARRLSRRQTRTGTGRHGSRAGADRGVCQSVPRRDRVARTWRAHRAAARIRQPAPAAPCSMSRGGGPLTRPRPAAH